MRIMIVSLYFHPDRAANAVIMTRLAQELAKLGHKIRVICAMPHYDTNAIWPDYRGKLLQRDKLGDIDIVRVWLYVPAEKTRLLGRIWNYLTFNLFSTLAGLVGPRPDVILAPSPPLTIGLTAWLLGLLRRAPYVYNVQDIYPDVAIRLGALANKRVIRFLFLLERFVYHHAGAISVLSEGFRRNLGSKGVPTEKIAIIPNFVDTEFIKPGPKQNALARRERLADRFVVLFAGNMGMAQGLDQMLEAADLLRDSPGILFLLAGGGTARAALEHEAARRELENVRFLPFMAFEHMCDLHAASDVCLIPLRRGIAQESVPSKALTIMAAGRPVVAAVEDDSDIGRLLCTSGCGLVVPPEDPKALSEAILTLYDDPTCRAQLGASGRRYVVAHHTPKIIARKYDTLLRRVTLRGGLSPVSLDTGE